MLLHNDKEEFELSYTIGAFMALKKELKTDNLRKCLLWAAEHEEFETLARAVRAFSGGRLRRPEDACPLIDGYMQEHGVSAYDLFIDLITEAGQAGFFKERLSRAEVAALGQSPELEMDMEALTAEAMARFKSRLLDRMVDEAAGTMTTGATTSPTSPPPPTAAE